MQRLFKDNCTVVTIALISFIILAVIIDYIYPYTVHLPSYKVHFHRIYLTGTRMILTSPCKFLVTRINKNLARFCIILQDHKYKQDHTRSGKIPV